jgi:hypothetical protein
LSDYAQPRLRRRSDATLDTRVGGHVANRLTRAAARLSRQTIQLAQTRVLQAPPPPLPSSSPENSCRHARANRLRACCGDLRERECDTGIYRDPRRLRPSVDVVRDAAPCRDWGQRLRAVRQSSGRSEGERLEVAPFAGLDYLRGSDSRRPLSFLMTA